MFALDAGKAGTGEAAAAKGIALLGTAALSYGVQSTSVVLRRRKSAQVEERGVKQRDKKTSVSKQRVRTLRRVRAHTS